MFRTNAQTVPFAQVQARRPYGGDMRLEDTLSAELFLSQLQRERRRSERTKDPLSLAVFRYDSGNINELAAADRLAQHLHRIKRDIDVVGYIDVGTIGVILLDTNAEGAQRFLLRLSTRLNGLRFLGTTFTFPDNIFDRLLSGVDACSPAQSIFFDRTNGCLQAIAKRLIDIVIASTVLVLCAPLMLATAIAVAMTSPGPAIFRQTRLGKDGTPLVMNKFRSMYQDADERIHRDHVAKLIGDAPDGEDEANDKKTWQKLDNDPRITPIGRIIRNLKIDELPQLFNVLKGDLSLVGPRPPIPYEVAFYQAWHLGRILAVKPGITGFWQIESGGNVTFDDMVRMDLQYVANASILLDLKILYRTAAVVVRRAIAFIVSPGAFRNGSC